MSITEKRTFSSTELMPRMYFYRLFTKALIFCYCFALLLAPKKGSSLAIFTLFVEPKFSFSFFILFCKTFPFARWKRGIRLTWRSCWEEWTFGNGQVSFLLVKTYPFFSSLEFSLGAWPPIIFLIAGLVCYVPHRTQHRNLFLLVTLQIIVWKVTSF